MKDRDTEKILSEIEFGYDLIAEKFSGTRAFMWRDLGFLKDLVKSGDRVLDYGCGNGRLAGFLDGDYEKYFGVDISQKLIDIAKQRYHSEKTEFIKISSVFERSDRATKKESGRTSLALPFENNYFDVVFSIAVFHHFPSKEYSMKVAKELRRVLKLGGKIVVTVWNLWQKQFLRFDLKNLKRSNLENKSDWRSLYIPFKSGEKVFNRYHHPFKMGELEEIFSKSGFKKLETKEGWNLVYIGQKAKL